MVGRAFTLRWSGADTASDGLVPSGIARYEVWRSANGRPYRRIASTSATRLRTVAAVGSRYAYYTIAVDRAGNREAVPATADARTRRLRPR